MLIKVVVSVRVFLLFISNRGTRIFSIGLIFVRITVKKKRVFVIFFMGCG